MSHSGKSAGITVRRCRTRLQRGPSSSSTAASSFLFLACPSAALRRPASARRFGVAERLAGIGVQLADAHVFVGRRSSGPSRSCGTAGGGEFRGSRRRAPAARRTDRRWRVEARRRSGQRRHVVPTPRWLRISPSLESSSYAWRTMSTATPRSSASCVIGRQCAPSGTRPSRCGALAAKPSADIAQRRVRPEAPAARTPSESIVRHAEMPKVGSMHQLQPGWLGPGVGGGPLPTSSGHRVSPCTAAAPLAFLGITRS